MIQILVNTIDVTDQIESRSLSVIQNLTNQVDTAAFSIVKYGSKTFDPSYDDDVEIYDGGDKIFGGKILQVSSDTTALDAVVKTVKCVDHTYEMDKRLVARVYEGETVSFIVNDMLTTYAPSFTSVNVTSSFLIEKIVFNQLPISTCIRRLCDILTLDWYVDEVKDVHIFSKETNEAPFDITDTNGNHIYKTLRRSVDGSQVANRVKVRGGVYNGSTYTDIITVVGNDTKAFTLPYQFDNITIELDTGAGYVSKNVGLDNIDNFTTDDVLYNFQQRSIRFQNPLANGNKIQISGNPKVRVFGIAEDNISSANYGKIEKLIRDDGIVSNEVARRRAAAELYAYAETQVDARFTTYSSGLRAGMRLSVQSTLRDFADDLIIKTLTFRPLDNENFVYQAECISTKRVDFLDLLAKIIEPAPLSIDETEVAEEIYTDTQAATIAEEYDVVSAFEAFEGVSIAENYIREPFGANVDALYVLAPYTPTSQTDPLRIGRLDISFTVY